MTICIIGCPAWKNLRGPQKFLMRFSKWLHYRSIACIVICGSLEKLVRSIDINNASMMMTSEDEESALSRHFPSIVHSLLFSFLSFLKIIHLNKKYHFSIIQAHDANYCAMAAIAAAKFLHVPVVLRVGAINMGVIRLLIRPKWLEKSVVARLYRAYYLFLQKELIKRSSCVICVSENDKRRLPNIGKNIVIPNAIDTTSFQAFQEPADIHEELGIPEHAFTMGYVGALSAEKGLQTLLRSFYYVLQEMPRKASTYLLIVGSGPEKKSLEDLAHKLGIRQYLRLTGFRNDVAKLLSIMDIFVFPSESEGSPAAILEAMAAGKPIIACDIPSIREIARHGEEAILIDSDNLEALKQAILLLYNDPELRFGLGNRAKQRVMSYDAETVFGRMLNVYEDLV